MYSLTLLLTTFWEWAGISRQEYATISDPSITVEPFLFPEFETLRNECKQQINTEMLPSQMDDFLTCLALDSEEEVILSWCIDSGSIKFLDKLVCAGCYHLQPEARWQIAALLYHRKLPKHNEYIKILLEDSNEYVRKRAEQCSRPM